MSHHLLSDDDVVSFLTKGYHIVTPTCSAAVHAAVTAQADAHDAARDGVVTGNADTPYDEVQRQQDLFTTVPAFDEVVCDAAVQGALTSLLGANYKLQTHRTNHYKRSHGEDQNFHVDGQWRNLDAGWFRNYRRALDPPPAPPCLPARLWLTDSCGVQAGTACASCCAFTTPTTSPRPRLPSSPARSTSPR
jgi:hypothetical protein